MSLHSRHTVYSTTHRSTLHITTRTIQHMSCPSTYTTNVRSNALVSQAINVKALKLVPGYVAFGALESSRRVSGLSLLYYHTRKLHSLLLSAEMISFFHRTLHLAPSTSISLIAVSIHKPIATTQASSPRQYTMCNID
jgi:hypothetical protein